MTDGNDALAQLDALQRRQNGADDPPPVAGPEDYGLGEAPPAPAELPALEVVPAAQFAGQPVPFRPFHVERLIPARTVTLLGGDGGTGKSLLALQLAVATVIGAPWVGHELEKGPVIYVGAEDDLDEIHRRLDAIAKDLSVSLDRLDDLKIVPLAGCDAILATPARGGIIAPTTLWRQIDDFTAEARPRLVVFDTLADLFGGDENIRAQARQFVGMLRGLAIRHNTTALLLAHPSLSGISSGSGLSGSTAWSNSVRSRLYLERVIDKADGEAIEPDPDLRALRTVKNNYGRTGGEIRLRWADGVFRLADGATVGTDGIQATQARAETTFMELLAAYDTEGRHVSAQPSSNYAPTIFSRDPRAKGIGRRHLADAMNRLFDAGRIRVEEVGPASKRRSKVVAT